MQIRRGKAREIWSRVMMSGRQRVDTQRAPEGVIIPVLSRSVPGIVNNEWYGSSVLRTISLVPRRSMLGEKSTWYPLFAHARLPRFFVGNLETTAILV